MLLRNTVFRTTCSKMVDKVVSGRQLPCWRTVASSVARLPWSQYSFCKAGKSQADTVDNFISEHEHQRGTKGLTSMLTNLDYHLVILFPGRVVTNYKGLVLQHGVRIHLLEQGLPRTGTRGELGGD